MKRLICIITLLVCGVAVASQKSRIIEWVRNQNFTQAQIRNFTRAQLDTVCVNHNTDPNKVQPFYYTIKNAAMSDWRKKNAEQVRSGTQTVVCQYRPGTNVITIGIERSIIDPNSTVMVFRMEVPL